MFEDGKLQEYCENKNNMMDMDVMGIQTITIMDVASHDIVLNEIILSDPRPTNSFDSLMRTKFFLSYAEQRNTLHTGFHFQLPPASWCTATCG